MTLGDFSLEMTFIQRDGVCQPQVPLPWVRHPLSLCENNSFFPYPAMYISLSLFCLWKCLFSKLPPEAALGNCPHTEMEWGVSYLLWVPVSALCMGMQEGLGTADPRIHRGVLHQLLVCRDGKALLLLSKFCGSNTCSVSPEIKAMLFSAPSFWRLTPHLLLWPLLLTEQLSSVICPWWYSQCYFNLLANRQQQMAQSR